MPSSWRRRWIERRQEQTKGGLKAKSSRIESASGRKYKDAKSYRLRTSFVPSSIVISVTSSTRNHGKTSEKKLDCWTSKGRQ